MACKQGKEWLIPKPVLHLGICFIQCPSLCKNRTCVVFFFFPQHAQALFHIACLTFLLCSGLGRATSLMLPQQLRFWVSNSCSSSVETAAHWVPSPQVSCEPRAPWLPACMTVCSRHVAVPCGAHPALGGVLAACHPPAPTLASLPRRTTASASEEL